MANKFKFFIIWVMFFAVIVFMVFTVTRHEANVASTQDVEVALKSSMVGAMRDSATNALDKKALVANLVLEVVKTQKGQGKNIKIDYVFLDKNGNPTEDDTKIDSVQFKVSILDGNNNVVSSSTQRIALKKIPN